MEQSYLSKKTTRGKGLNPDVQVSTSRPSCLLEVVSYKRLSNPKSDRGHLQEVPNIEL